MREFRKRILAAAAVAALASQGLFATGYPVLDISNLMNGIQQLYTTYEQINNTITQIQNTYKQIEQAVNQVKNFDWSNVKDAAKKYANSLSDLSDMSAWELLTDKDKVMATKSNLIKFNKSISDSVSVYTNVLHKMDESTVTVNGKKFSPLGLFGVGKHGDGTVVNLAADSTAQWVKDNKDIVDAFAGDMTQEEKERTYREMGFSGDSALALKLTDTVIDGDADVLISAGSEMGTQFKDNWSAAGAGAVASLEGIAGEEESQNQVAQAGIIATQNVGKEIAYQTEIANKYYSYEVRVDRLEKKKRQDEIEKQMKEEANERATDQAARAAQLEAGDNL